MIHAIVGTRMHDYNRALYDHRTEADVLLEKEKDGRMFFLSLDQLKEGSRNSN